MTSRLALVAFVAVSQAGGAVDPEKQAVHMQPGVLCGKFSGSRKIFGKQLGAILLSKGSFDQCLGSGIWGFRVSAQSQTAYAVLRLDAIRVTRISFSFEATASASNGGTALPICR